MKLWGGRFTGRTDPRFEQFSESFSLDQRLVLYDLQVNRAYVRALGEAGVFDRADVRRLTQGLDRVRRYIQDHPDWARDESSEDIHTWIEARLEREGGRVARKLRTGRSRNDLVATEMRLYVKDATIELERATVGLLEALVSQARRRFGQIMPGYTHLQPAQPVLFSHYLLAYYEMFLRDRGRLEACRERADELPLGAGALAGTTFAIDRRRLARELGFARVARNSLDVTSDRDFVCELLFACTLVLAHLSRLAEDFIVFSSPGFGAIELADAYTTGSSLMPQKKNPDALELIRGKAARLLGRLTSTIALLKGLPLAYNRDLQEDKAPLFDGVDTTLESLEMAARVVRTMRVAPERMKAATAQGFLTATDLADELVRRGVPFAEAHEQVGRLVRACVSRKKTFLDVSLEEARRHVPGWDVKLQRIAASADHAAGRRKVLGGTAPAQVARQLRAAEATLRVLKRRLAR